MAGDLGPVGIDDSALAQQATANARLPFWDALGESAADAWQQNPIPGLYRDIQMRAAQGIGEPTWLPSGPFDTPLGVPYQTAPLPAPAPTPESQPIDVASMNKEHGDLGLTFTPDMNKAMADLLVSNRQDELRRQSALNDAPNGILFGGARLATSLAVSASDPINIAAAFVPIVGETRYGLWAARFGKTLARVGQGAVEGGVGTALLQPLQAANAATMQDEFTPYDAFLNTAFGSVLGGGLHAGLGKISDMLSRAAPETREGALRSAVAQAAEGRTVDVSPVLATDHETVSLAAPERLPSAPELLPEDIASARLDVKYARTAAPKEQSLLDVVRDLGGVRTMKNGERIPEAGDVEQALKDFKGKPFQRRVVNNETGLTPDYLREALVERGWLAPDADLNDLYDLLASEAQGSKVYHPDSNIHQELSFRAQLDEDLGRAGVASSDSLDAAARKVAEYRLSEQRQPDEGRLPEEQRVVQSYGDAGTEPFRDQGGPRQAGDQGQGSGDTSPGQGSPGGDSSVQGAIAQAGLERARQSSRDFAAGTERSSVEPSPEAVARAEADLKAGDDPEAELQDAMAQLQAYRAQGIISDAEWESLSNADAADAEAAKMDSDAAQAAARCLYLHP